MLVIVRVPTARLWPYSYGQCPRSSLWAIGHKFQTLTVILRSFAHVQIANQMSVILNLSYRKENSHGCIKQLQGLRVYPTSPHLHPTPCPALLSIPSSAYLKLPPSLTLGAWAGQLCKDQERSLTDHRHQSTANAWSYRPSPPTDCPKDPPMAATLQPSYSLSAPTTEVVSSLATGKCAIGIDVLRLWASTLKPSTHWYTKTLVSPWKFP